PLEHSIFLFTAALVAGALNSVAGGGGVIAFPALIFVGAPPIQANATYTAALLPGGIASIGAYRKTYSESPQSTRLLLPIMVIGIAGGVMGALLLLNTPAALFMDLVPWLLLMATALFAISPRVVPWMRARASNWKHGGRAIQLFTALLQLAIAIYIGYFGAGAGIMVLAMLALMGVENIHVMNGLKVLLVVVCNVVALITYAAGNAVIWSYAGLMIVGGIIGGYGGAWVAQKMSPSQVRYFVIATGLVMSVYFFVR
ncbi:MAG: sulfite exporter TauE/SafE family protein, partial [Candidatus Korobacteraceae bacterium]